MPHYAIATVKSNPDRIILHCGTDNLKMEESPEAIAEKIIELAKRVSNFEHHPRRDKLANKESKVNSNVENFCKEDESIKFKRQKSLDSTKHIGKDGIHLNNFGITQIVLLC